MNLDRLRALDAVACHGSVNAAAAALHLTTSAVSQQLSKLERDVGETLVERQGRGIRLTDAARALADHAGVILAQVEAAEADLAARRGEVRGHVTLAAFASAARGIVPGALQRLGERYPDLAVELRELEMDASIQLTERSDVDVAVVNDWDTEPLALPESLDRASVVDDVFDVVLPADHPLAGQESVDLADLAEQPWIGWTKDSICYQWLVRTMRAKGIEPIISHTAEEHPTQMALVAAGLGAAVLPRIGRTASVDGVAVVGLRPRLSRHVYVVWRRAAAGRPAIRAVVDSLRESADEVRELDRRDRLDV